MGLYCCFHVVNVPECSSYKGGAAEFFFESKDLENFGRMKVEFSLLIISRTKYFLRGGECNDPHPTPCIVFTFRR